MTERNSKIPYGFAIRSAGPPSESHREDRKRERESKSEVINLENTLSPIQEIARNKLKNLRSKMKTIFNTENVQFSSYAYELLLDAIADNKNKFKCSMWYYEECGLLSKLNIKKLDVLKIKAFDNIVIKRPLVTLYDVAANIAESMDQRIKPIYFNIKSIEYTPNDTVSFNDYNRELILNQLNGEKSEIYGATLKTYDDIPNLITKKKADECSLKYSPDVFLNRNEIDDTKSGCPACYLCGRRIYYINEKGKEEKLKLINMQVEHIIPFITSYITGVINFPMNYVYTHKECNGLKSDNLPVEIESISSQSIKSLLDSLESHIDYEKLTTNVAEDVKNLISKQLKPLFDDDNFEEEVKINILRELLDEVFRLIREDQRSIIERDHIHATRRTRARIGGAKSREESYEPYEPEIHDAKISRAKYINHEYNEFMVGEIRHTIAVVLNDIGSKYTSDMSALLIIQELITYLEMSIQSIESFDNRPRSRSRSASRSIMQSGGAYESYFKQFDIPLKINQADPSLNHDYLMTISERVKFLENRFYLFNIFSFNLCKAYSDTQLYSDFIKNRLQYCLDTMPYIDKKGLAFNFAD
jgi:hypothetical protein